MREHSPFGDRYGPWALVAGAAEGIGAAFAAKIANRGVHVALLDCDVSVRASAEALADSAGVETRAVVVDLGSADVLAQVEAGIGDLPVGLLVYNAARSYVGPFLEQDPADVQALIDVNCRGLVRLVHAHAGRMKARGHGGVILLSSLAGISAHAWTASYGATKAFTLVLAEALGEELRQDGVDVLAVCPGPTRTPGYLASRPRLPDALVMDPATVADEALGALGHRSVVIPGAANRWTAGLLQRALPRGMAARLMGRLMRVIYSR